MTTKRATPRWLRRAPWEHGTTALIALGLAMLMQPWSIDVYSYGFTVMLVEFAMFLPLFIYATFPRKRRNGG